MDLSSVNHTLCWLNWLSIKRRDDNFSVSMHSWENMSVGRGIARSSESKTGKRVREERKVAWQGIDRSWSSSRTRCNIRLFHTNFNFDFGWFGPSETTREKWVKPCFLARTNTLPNSTTVNNAAIHHTQGLLRGFTESELNKAIARTTISNGLSL